MGVRISVGGISDPALTERTYEDIRNILHGNKQDYIEYETLTEQGTFKSFTIET